MKSLKLFAIFITAGAGLPAPAKAQQPPDVVQSDTFNNTAMGTGALLNNSTSSNAYNPLTGTTDRGVYNTASGAGALYGNTNGSYNSASGFGALHSNSTGYDNTASGSSALYNNTTGSYNTASGFEALLLNSTGNGNSAFGFFALTGNTTGYDNTASGFDALSSNTTGYLNIASGSYALYSNAGGYANIASGAYALYSNTAGNFNTAFGFDAGFSVGGSNNIDIGANVYGGSADNGVIRIGTQGTQTQTYIAGIYGTTLTGSAVYVTSSGKLGVLASSERYKTAITSMGEATDKLHELRPVTFHLKTEPDGALQYGLIAEEVDKIYPELVIRDDDGKIQGVRYDELAPMLLNEVQKQKSQLEQQSTQLKEMQQLKEQVRSQSSLLQQVWLQLAELKKQDGSKHAAVSKTPAIGKRVAAH